MEVKKTTEEKAQAAVELVEAVAVDGGSYFKYKLSRPIKVADKEYSELTVDFGSLTGADMESIAAISSKNDVNISEFSKSYLMHVVARAAGITINELRKFPITDCTKLTLRAMGFLMGAASEATDN